MIVAVVSLAVDWWRSPKQPVYDTETVWATLSGEPVYFSGLGTEHTAIVYFWGSWCGVCRYTSPVIHKLSQAGVPVVSVALHSGSDQEVAGYLKRQGWSFATVNDTNGQLGGLWQIKATPTVVMVKNGQIRHSTSGISSYWGLWLRWKLVDWLY